MVYLSRITLDPRPRAVSRILQDLYALHQYVYSAFSGYERSELGRILFRLDTDERRLVPKLLVQSDQEPDWSRLGASAVEVCGPKRWEPAFAAGQIMRFRLRASPSKRVPYPRGHPKHGNQRIGLLTLPEQAKWLENQGVRGGFELMDTPDWFDPFDNKQPRIAVQIASPGHLTGQKFDSETGKPMTVTHLSVDFDGLLRVTDAEAFVNAVQTGLGSGKSFGFGLLSLARA